MAQLGPTTIYGALKISGGVEVRGALSADYWIAGSINGLTLSKAAIGFAIAGGTTSKALTVSTDVTLDQNLSKASAVTFVSVNSIKPEVINTTGIKLLNTATSGKAISGYVDVDFGAASTNTGKLTFKSNNSTARVVTLGSDLETKTAKITLDGTSTGSTLKLPAGTFTLNTATAANHVAFYSAVGELSGEAQLAMSRGGTNANLSASAGGIVYSISDKLAILSGVAANEGKALLSGGTGEPTWTTGTLTLGTNFETKTASITLDGTSGGSTLKLPAGTTTVSAETSGFKLNANSTDLELQKTLIVKMGKVTLIGHSDNSSALTIPSGGGTLGTAAFKNYADAGTASTIVMRGSGGQIQATGLTTSWGSTSGTATGALNAIMGTSTSATWLWSGTSGGTFRAGMQVLDGGDSARLYIADKYVTYAKTSAGVEITASKVYNAVWHDIADFLKIDENVQVEYGKAYIRDCKGVHKTTKKATSIGIASDTYGFGVGQDLGKRQIPIAIGGWVLAHVDKVYKAGTCLVASKDGVLTKASLTDKVFCPERIIAIFDRVEHDDVWNGIPVNGRHWVKVK